MLLFPRTQRQAGARAGCFCVAWLLVAFLTGPVAAEPRSLNHKDTERTEYGSDRIRTEPNQKDAERTGYDADRTRAGEPVLDVLRSDAGGVVVRYETGSLVFARSVDGQTRVELPGAEYPAAPGDYDLPVKRIRVGLPQEGGFRTHVRQGPARSFEGIEPTVAVAVSRDDLPGDAPRPWSAGPGLRHRVSEIMTASDPRFIRGVRFVELELELCRYDPGARRLVIPEWVEVELRFDREPTENPRPDPLDHVIAGMLVNGGPAIVWKQDPPPRQRSFFDRSTHWVKLTISRTGMHSVTGRELAEAGVSIAGIDPRTLAMYALGEYPQNGPYPDTMVRVAVHLECRDETRFGSDDRVIFYARAADHWTDYCSTRVSNLYTGNTAYWLTWGLEPGLRMAVGLGPDTAGARTIVNGRWRVHQEENLENPARSGLLWVWRTIRKDSYRASVGFDIPMTVEMPVRLTGLSGQFYAATNENRVVLLLNGSALDTLRFNAAPAAQPYRFRVDAEAPLMARENVLRLELQGEGSRRVMLDYLQYDIIRRLALDDGQCRFLQDDTGTFRFRVQGGSGPVYFLDVTDPFRPMMADGVHYDDGVAVVTRRVGRPSEFCIADRGRLLKPEAVEIRRPGRLRAPERTAEYWIVAPREFMPAATRLARYRTGNIAWLPGARVAVAALDDIYDDYAFGIEEPGAIKAFFADKRPVYGLLAGDATYDYRDNLGLQAHPVVPSWQVGYSLDPSGISGRDAYALDAWYADFDGAGVSPDMILGRVTSRSGAELSAYVDKLIDYETAPAGLWNRRYLLLGDDEWSGEPGRPDPIGFRHIEQCEMMGVLPGSSMDPVKVYLTEHPFVGIKNKPGARAELLRELNAGALVFVFFGHGDAFDLCHESAFNITQVPDVTNVNRLPFCYFGSCSVGRFDDTRTECIAEELVRSPHGGAIVTVGATKATTSGSNTVFARNLLVPLFGDPDSTVGVAFFQAWPTDRLYHLFGDPATRLRRVADWPEPLMVRPDTLRPAAAFRARALLGDTRGHCQWRLSGPQRIRHYRSERGTTNYVLPGVTLARGGLAVESGRLEFDGLFPLGVELDTVRVKDGSFIPVPGSARVAAVVASDRAASSVILDAVHWDRTPAPADDGEGPEVRLYMGGRELTDGAEVPPTFELEGVISDRSGIMVAPVPGWAPVFYTGRRSESVELTDLLVFDHAPVATARFRLPVRLNPGEDTLWTLASDNLLNRTRHGVAVRVHSAAEPLRLDSVLVFPNPAQGHAWIAFELNRAANVRVRIFTLSGRLVRDLGDRPAAFGYNQFDWDGRDANGNQPANGVYLFTITARAPGAAGYETVQVRDRFLVLR